jgi:hypothetical protein
VRVIRRETHTFTSYTELVSTYSASPNARNGYFFAYVEVSPQFVMRLAWLVPLCRHYGIPLV